MSPTDIEILRDALHCLRTYRQNSTELAPYGRHGHSIGSVISNLEHVIAKHEIPPLKKVLRRPVKLNLEEWK